MAHKIQERDEKGKQAEPRRKKRSPIEFIEVIVARGSFERRPRFSFLDFFLLLCLTRPLPARGISRIHINLRSSLLGSSCREEVTMHE